MDDLIDGTINGWPVSLLIERDLGDVAYGANCSPYTKECEYTGEDLGAPDDIWDACYAITDACGGLKPKAALCKAAKLGFVPDRTQ
jgi:hypothetical protein